MSGEVPKSRPIERDPELGWRAKPNYRTAKATHNSQGFRGSQEFEPKSAGRRILTIGDSFTYGAHVSDDATYAARLSELLDAEVINAGVGGYGIDQALLMWETKGRHFHPDTVVVGYFTGDFHRNALSVPEFPKPRFVVSDDRSGLAYVEKPEVVDIQWHFRGFDVLQMGWRRFADYLGFLPVSMLDERQRLSERLLARLQSSVSDAGANLVVLIIPHCAYPRDGHYGSWIATKVATSCTLLGLACIDFTDMVDSSLYKYCHWNEEGHHRAAQKIAETLRLPR
jgi:hypothetical protein